MEDFATCVPKGTNAYCANDSGALLWSLKKCLGSGAILSEKTGSPLTLETKELGDNVGLLSEVSDTACGEIFVA